VLSAQGDLTAALAAYRASLEIRARLAAADPGNALWQRDLSVSHDRIGDVLSAQGDLTAALAAYRASLEIRARLAAADPGNAGWQRDLWVSYWRMASMTEQTGSGDARQWWRKAYDVLSGMKQRGLFVSAQDEQFLSQLRAKIGE
jgi:tetratricopeptide (TPR) repeat protein